MGTEIGPSGNLGRLAPQSSPFGGNAEAGDIGPISNISALRPQWSVYGGNAEAGDIGVSFAPRGNVAGDPDLIAPTVAFGGSSSLATKTTSITFDVTDFGTGLAFAHVGVSFNQHVIGATNVVVALGAADVTGGTFFGGGAAGSSVVVAPDRRTMSFTIAPDTSWLSASFTVFVYAVDRAGNASLSSRVYTCSSADVTGPTMSNFSPAAGSTIVTGSTLQFDLTDPIDLDASSLLLSAALPSGAVETVYTGGAFVAPYLTSSISSITGGRRFIVQRTGGWPIAGGSVTLVATAADANTFNTSSSSYSVITLAPPDTTPPTFAGVVDFISPTRETLTATWLPATDVGTAQSDLEYDACWATSAGACTGGNFVPMATSVPGATSLVVAGLATGTTYYVCVRARDRDGNRDTNNVTASATTTAADVAPPTVGNYSPAPTTSITPTTPISFDVTDNDLFRRIVVVVRYPTNTGELVHDGDQFVGPFVVASSRATISGGYRFTLARVGGWPASPAVQVFATDRAGNENT